MIEINDLTFGYKKRHILFDHLSIQMPLGNIYGLLGKNGAGKTTFLKHITGLLYPTKGECLLFGKPSQERLPEVLNDLYLIPEEFQLPAIRMNEFAHLHAPFYPRFDFDLYKQYLSEFQVEGNVKLTTLSYGQKKKFLIAFGLATRTRLLILDEPTNGLDIPSKSQFRKIIASSMDAERSILISTHQVRDLARLIDYIVILENGKIVFQQSTFDISSRLAFAQTKDLSNLEVLYTEDIFGGQAVIYRKQNEETEIDLELLFNGIITNSAIINKEFNKETL
jgi:ABC-2 type transport system ATP-binding protein